MINCKCVVVGDSASGKTSMIERFCSGEFSGKYDPTVFDHFSKTLEVDGKTINLNIWDTAGDEEYDRLRPISYGCTEIFIICCSVGSHKSLLNVKRRWVPELNYHRPATPFILIGTKSEIRESPWKAGFSRQEAEQLAKDVGAIMYMECSALKQEGKGAIRVFLTAVRAFLIIREQTNSSRRVRKENIQDLLVPSTNVNASNVLRLVQNEHFIIDKDRIEEIVPLSLVRRELLIHTLKYTNLHFRPELAKALMKYDKKLCEFQDSDGSCCLHVIAEFGLLVLLDEILKLYQGNCAWAKSLFTCKRKSDIDGCEEETPLDVALMYTTKVGSERYRIMEKFLKMGARQVDLSRGILHNQEIDVYKGMLYLCEEYRVSAPFSEEERKKLVFLSSHNKNWVDVVVRRAELSPHPSKAAKKLSIEKFNINTILDDKNHWTLLIKASVEGNVKLLKALFRFTNLAFEVVDVFGETAWDKAVRLADEDHRAMQFFLKYAELNESGAFERGMATMSTLADLTTDLLTIIFMFIPEIQRQMEEDCESARENSGRLDIIFQEISWSCSEYIITIRSILVCHAALLIIPQLQTLINIFVDNQKLNTGKEIREGIAGGSSKFFSFYNYQSKMNSGLTKNTIFSCVNFIFTMIYTMTTIVFSTSSIWLFFFIPIVLTTWLDFELSLRGSDFARSNYCRRRRNVVDWCKCSRITNNRRSIGNRGMAEIPTIYLQSDRELPQDNSIAACIVDTESISQNNVIEAKPTSDQNECKDTINELSSDLERGLEAGGEQNIYIPFHVCLKKGVCLLGRSCLKMFVRFLNMPLINFFTFITVVFLFVGNYVLRLTRIDVNFFIHGASGFREHQLIRLCCCKCAVIDDGNSDRDPIETSDLYQQVYARQSGRRWIMKTIVSGFLIACKWICCCPRARERCSCIKMCADCMYPKTIQTSSAAVPIEDGHVLSRDSAVRLEISPCLHASLELKYAE